MEVGSDPTVPSASKTLVAEPERRRSDRVASRADTQSTSELEGKDTQQTTLLPQLTAAGASKTPIADLERRRSARVASRVNTQSTSEFEGKNTQQTTPISQPTTKQKVTQKNAKPTKSAGQRASKQATKNKGAKMTDSTDEPPRKNQRRRDGTSSRQPRTSAGPSRGSNSEASAGSLAPGAANPVIGREERSGYNVSSDIASPRSGQQPLSRGNNSSQIAQPSMSHVRRVPGMPTPMPRSDTPPPIFDTTNPYSVFSENAAIPQRRPLPTAGRWNIPASLPSLPSDQALTDALEGSIRRQAANLARGKLDHRDPNWRHPWGVPVEPLPPTPQPYVHVDPQERAIMAAQNANANQAHGECEVFYGLDEHVPLGAHPIDMAYTQFLINHNAQEDGSGNHMDNAVGISHDLREFDNFFNTPSLATDPQLVAAASSQYVASDAHYTASGVQPLAQSDHRIASGIQHADPNVQPASHSVQSAANVHRTTFGVQPAARSTQSAPPGMQPGNLAGNANDFPGYPHGYLLPSANPPITNSNASMLLNNQAIAVFSEGADAEDVRRTSLAASIMGSLIAEKDKAEKTKAKGKVPVHRTMPHNYQSQPGFQKLALGKIRLAKTSPTGRPTCTFCIFTCDWGVSDDRYRLLEKASTGSCHECSNPNSGSFSEEFTTALKSRTDQASKDAQEQALNEPVHAEPVVQHGEKVYSAIDGADITKFMGPMFCKTSPYGQLDVNKVRMCEFHKNEKFAIIKHHRHREFRQIGFIMPEDELSADEVRRMNTNDAEDRIRENVANHSKLTAKHKDNRRCMMCTGYATDICADCPLRICANCSTFLKNNCKGYLDNLFYQYERHHLRNDAFLLRSDGGGF